MNKFHGSSVALITPFNAEGGVDFEGFEAFVEWQIKQGTHGLVPVGTTGESPTVTHQEHRMLVKKCIEISKGRADVIAGAGSNSTQEAMDLVKFAQEAGAEAAMCVVPYYNKPSQEGLYAHFKAIHDSCDIGILIYNVPGRVKTRIDVDTIVRLSELPRILGVKDATADLAEPALLRHHVREDFLVLSGEDATALPHLVQGGDGCISVTANAAPKLLSQMHESWKSGNVAQAQAINHRLMPLHIALFCETSPGPVKYAVHRICGHRDSVRLPILSASDAAKRKVDDALAFAGLI